MIHVGRYGERHDAAKVVQIDLLAGAQPHPTGQMVGEIGEQRLPLGLQHPRDVQEL